MNKLEELYAKRRILEEFRKHVIREFGWTIEEV